MGDQRRVLLLGARGFIGRHAAVALEEARLTVLSAVDDHGQSLDLLSADLLALLAGTRPDVVVNCAGRTEGKPSALQAANVTLVARLVRALRAHRTVRLVHIGSAAEYGRGGGTPTSEAASEVPLTPYGGAKLAATRLIRSADIDAVILRVFNPIGAGMAADSMPGRAAELIREAVRDGRGWITMGSLSAERDFIHVADVADAIAAAILADRPPGLLNIGTGSATAARTVVELIAELAGFGGEIRETTDGSPRSDQVTRQVADSSLARRSLGWQPRRTLREAVHDLWRGG